ncbi:MAG: cupin domain-containing protein, partial [Armatimonadota bacterium]
MKKPQAPGTWTTAPERRIQDLAVQNPAWTAEHIHETFLRIGLTAVNSPESKLLLLPPLKSYAPKQAAKRKDLHQHRNVEVGVVLRGEMTIWWEGITHRCPAGTLFVIPPGIRYMPHVRTTESTTPHSVIWLAVHKSYAVIHRCSMEGNHHMLSEYFSFTNALLMSQARVIAQELA